MIIEDISRNQRGHQSIFQTISSRKLESPVNRDSLRSTQNSHQLLKNVNKNQSDLTSHFTRTILENPFITKRRRKTMKKHESSPIETDEKILNTKADRNVRKIDISSITNERFSL